MPRAFNAAEPRRSTAARALSVAAPLFVCVLAGCGESREAGNSAATNTARQAAPEGDLTIIPMSLSAGSKSAELQADGTVLSGGRVIGRFARSSFMSPDGAHSLTVTPAGVVLADGKDGGVKFTEENELVGPRNLRVSVADDGTATVADDGNKAGSKLTLTGFKPAARRTAVLLVTAFLGSGDSGRAP